MVLTDTGLAKVLQRIKSFIASQLNSKASAIHTHTSSDITDLPNGYVVDSALSSSSENAVQNKAVKSALDEKLDICTGGGVFERSGNGQYLYCQIATITILGSYVNSPIVLEISGKGMLFSTVQIVFESSSGTDPNLSKFVSDSYEYFYIKKIDTSTWAVYAEYTESWGNITVHRVSGTGLSTTNISCDFTASDLSELPSECTQVQPTIPTNTNQLTNGAGYITSSDSCSYANFSGYVQGDKSTGTYVESVKYGNALVTTNQSNFGAIWNAPTKNYRVACTTYPNSNDDVYLCYSITNANVSSSTNTTNKTLTWNAGDGTLSTANIKATSGLYYNSYKIYVG